MAVSRWARRRTRRRLRRGLTRFDARLRSSCPGIGFTARITASVLTDPPYAETDKEIVHAVRTVLRTAAEDVSKSCDPADLATARDRIEHHLRQQRTLPAQATFTFRAELTLELLPDDQAAVGALLAAQRSQAMTDILRQQKVEAAAAELADPAALLLRWVEREDAQWSKLPSLAEDARALAAVFAQHRPEHERTIEYQAIEVVREFLTSFPDHAQKRMLYTLLAAGMEGAQRPHHAAKAQALLKGHMPPDTPSGG
ncbi:hypothetical protein AB0M29_07360 [Streptomyces sp. NPDC051976]|uniref:hypothetical protein n=1 Tax=Streptomyces sp. NPDC051976 TaxID=3154947 RepID=UPI003442437B